MRVLIIGGGVAGTVAALAAHQAGLRPVVFEAYEQSAGKAHGVFLTVAVNGLDALRAVGADHVVRAAGFPSGRMTFHSGTGKRLGSLALGPELPDGTATHTLRRSDLYDGLAQEVAARGIEIRHGARLVAADLQPDGTVVARFADGSTVEGDVLVGADGVHSRTRQLLDPANPSPRYTGLGNTGGFADVTGIDAAPGDYAMIWGQKCFFGYTVAPDGTVWWFANPPSKTEIPRERLRGRTSAQLRQQVSDLAGPDHSPMARIVQATTGDIVLTNQYDLPNVPTWHRGPMVVIGDAAHAVSPASGQGASLAAEDAVLLAKCLRDLPVGAALAAYERQRRDRVERIVRWGASMNNTKQPGLVGRVLRDVALPFILKRAADPARMDAMAWMYRHHIDWDEPVEGAAGEPAWPAQRRGTGGE